MHNVTTKTEPDKFYMKKKKKMTMKQYEDSDADKKADEKELAAINRSKKKHYKKVAKKEAKPKPQGKGIVKALGQKGTTGNFKKIEASKGKGAAIASLQNKLAAHRGEPVPFKRHKATGKQLLGRAMKKMC